MKVSHDALITALLHPLLYLAGDGYGGVGLHCGDESHDGTLLAYYGEPREHPEAPTVRTIPSLWAEAVKHLDASHKTEARP